MVGKLYQHEFDALVSLFFNVGNMGKLPKLKSKLNQDYYKGAADEFLDLTNGGSPGLIGRRKKEWDLFLSNIYDSSR